MNKIKRQTVEELLQAQSLYDEEYDRNPNSQEFKNASNILCDLYFNIEVETTQSEETQKRLEWLTIDLIKAFSRANLSISRLLKCLEVCGIEVVE